MNEKQAIALLLVAIMAVTTVGAVSTITPKGDAAPKAPINRNIPRPLVPTRLYFTAIPSSVSGGQRVTFLAWLRTLYGGRPLANKPVSILHVEEHPGTGRRAVYDVTKPTDNGGRITWWEPCTCCSSRYNWQYRFFARFRGDAVNSGSETGFIAVTCHSARPPPVIVRPVAHQ